MGRAQRLQRRVWKDRSMQKEPEGNRKQVIGCLRNERTFMGWRVDQIPWLRERMVRKVKAGKARLGKPWKIWLDSKDPWASLKTGLSSVSWPLSVRLLWVSSRIVCVVLDTAHSLTGAESGDPPPLALSFRGFPILCLFMVSQLPCPHRQSEKVGGFPYAPPAHYAGQSEPSVLLYSSID